MRGKIFERWFHFLPLLGAEETSDMDKRWTHSQEMPLPIDFKEVQKKEERLRVFLFCIFFFFKFGWEAFWRWKTNDNMERNFQ